MQTDMGGYQPWQAGTSGSLKAYEPTWRDRLARVLMGEQKASPERARLVEGLTGSTGLGNSSLGLVDFVPGLGNAFQAQEEARKGEGANMMFAAVGGPPAKVSRAAAGAAGDVLTGGKLTPPPGITAFHGTKNTFDNFRIGMPSQMGGTDLGIHFGPEHQARQFGPNVYSAVLNPRNVIEIPAEIGSHGTNAPSLIVDALDKSGKFKPSDITMLRAEVDAGVDGNEVIRKFLIKNSYDAGVYDNVGAEGYGRSYVVFNPDAITRNSFVSQGVAHDTPDQRILDAFGYKKPPAGITAYHVSPHDFDRFDMSKIGTGEGAQAPPLSVDELLSVLNWKSR